MMIKIICSGGLKDRKVKRTKKLPLIAEGSFFCGVIFFLRRGVWLCGRRQ